MRDYGHGRRPTCPATLWRAESAGRRATCDRQSRRLVRVRAAEGWKGSVGPASQRLRTCARLVRWQGRCRRTRTVPQDADGPPAARGPGAARGLRRTQDAAPRRKPRPARPRPAADRPLRKGDGGHRSRRQKPTRNSTARCGSAGSRRNKSEHSRSQRTGRRAWSGWRRRFSVFRRRLPAAT